MCEVCCTKLRKKKDQIEETFDLWPRLWQGSHSWCPPGPKPETSKLQQTWFFFCWKTVLYLFSLKQGSGTYVSFISCIWQLKMHYPYSSLETQRERILALSSLKIHFWLAPSAWMKSQWSILLSLPKRLPTPGLKFFHRVDLKVAFPIEHEINCE